MPVPNDTLETLRSRLRARLGFSGAGAAAGVNQENLDAILQQAQVSLYWTHDWARLRRYTDTTVGADQYLINYPANAHPERIKAISVQVGSVWSPPLKKGITPQHYTTQDNTSRPYRWEPYEQIELWPKADQVYNVRIFYIKTLDDFDANDDRSTIDSDLIFTVALGDAKAHYRQPDAKTYADRAEALLLKMKARSWGQTTFNPNDYADDPLPKPVVV